MHFSPQINTCIKIVYPVEVLFWHTDNFQAILKIILSIIYLMAFLTIYFMNCSVLVTLIIYLSPDIRLAFIHNRPMLTISTCELALHLCEQHLQMFHSSQTPCQFPSVFQFKGWFCLFFISFSWILSLGSTLTTEKKYLAHKIVKQQSVCKCKLLMGLCILSIICY